MHPFQRKSIACIESVEDKFVGNILQVPVDSTAGLVKLS
jgi:hypothetical protein